MLHASAHECMIRHGGGTACSFLGHDYALVESPVHTMANNVNEYVTLKFGIKQRNVEKLEELLTDVSDPASINYGKHWTFEQVNRYFHNDEAAKKVEDWVKEFDEELTCKNTGNFVSTKAKLDVAQKILQTTFHIFESASTKLQVVRAFDYSLPDYLLDVIEFVADITTFPPIRHGSIVSYEPMNLFGSVTPSLINSFYQIDSNNASGTTQGVFESIGQMYSDSDNQNFMNANLIPMVTSNYVSFAGNFPNFPNNCLVPGTCDESMLDMEYLMGIAQNAQTAYYSMSGTSSFADWILLVSSTSNPPTVLSISYGETETPASPSYLTQFEGAGLKSLYSNSQSFMQKSFNTEAMKLGLRGVTIVVSSGDDGANIQDSRTSIRYCGISPTFPASSPAVLSVGATQGPEKNAAEVGCSSQTSGTISSGGGFSTFFATPSYQANAVKDYLSKPGIPPISRFSSFGRAYPDVSLLGNNYQVITSGLIGFVSGTSASAPVVAAMLSLINAARLKSGKPTLGFVNAALYRLANNASIFNDIVLGINNCPASTGNPSCCTYGFPATTGFDAMTGLGSLNFHFLKDALLTSYTPNASDVYAITTGSPSGSISSSLAFYPSYLVLLLLVFCSLVFSA